MRLLLDTHAFVWAVGSPSRLSDEASSAVADPGNVLLVSAASAWEIGTKFRLGKMPGVEPLVQDFAGMARRLGATVLPIEHEHAMLAGTLPWEHRDPFDRMLVAQAALTASTLVSRDTGMRDPLPHVLW
ncbi:type II toxin-antitoxin system VapC family toxin [Microbacterium sp.]|uniref:type II toxin-antitoxin system VapC family toxin n=1 Tax=Microbacterium sp. TaxID=51671 RepID=UPI003C774B34